MNLDFDNLDKRIAEKYINVQKHPTEDLYIHNYSHAAMFDGIRDNEIELCRGLILDGNRNVVARPFRKFYNFDQAVSYGFQFPLTNFEIFDKVDGSLGIMYFINDQPFIATRGSFTSEQAVKANEILQTKYTDAHFDPRFTYLFEIIIPWNRVVVDYGKMEDLVLLAIIETKTGLELPYALINHFGSVNHMPVVKKYDGIADFQTLAVDDDKEGYVVYWPETGQRCKLKGENYKKLHKILTQTNSRTIWEVLKANGSLEQLLERVPDEFNVFVKHTVRDLQTHYNMIEANSEYHFRNAWIAGESKKDFALKALKTPHPNILFAMYDGKSYSDMIWKLIRPEAEKPFKVEAE